MKANVTTASKAKSQKDHASLGVGSVNETEKKLYKIGTWWRIDDAGDPTIFCNSGRHFDQLFLTGSKK